MKNWIGKLIHNCIAHPLMCFLPKELGERFHDWTIEKLWSPRHKVKWDYQSDIITVDENIVGREE